MSKIHMDRDGFMFSHATSSCIYFLQEFQWFRFFLVPTSFVIPLSESKCTVICDLRSAAVGWFTSFQSVFTAFWLSALLSGYESEARNLLPHTPETVKLLRQDY
ncbi:hypothetical protein Mapa_002409 [Marchantia paleacea]|nr:hypothetical protein Mapa_002409 [Marchantia paleacea]